MNVNSLRPVPVLPLLRWSESQSLEKTNKEREKRWCISLEAYNQCMHEVLWSQWKRLDCQWAFPDHSRVVCLFSAWQRMQRSVTCFFFLDFGDLCLNDCCCHLLDIPKFGSGNCTVHFYFSFNNMAYLSGILSCSHGKLRHWESLHIY